MVSNQEKRHDPNVTRARPTGWWVWLRGLAITGKVRLASLGATLLLGFTLGLGALALFADLAQEVYAKETQVFDDSVTAWLQQFASPGMDAVMRGLSLMGSEAVAVLLVLVLLGVAVQRRWGAVVALLLTVGGAQMLNNVLKDLFHRTRPAPVAGIIPAQAFSFPSGHAMVSAAFYFFLAYLGWQLLRGWKRYLLAGCLMLLVLLIGVSRLYLQAHYFTDVVAGYLVGFLWTDAVIIGGRLLGRGRPVPAHPAEMAGVAAESAA